MNESVLARVAAGQVNAVEECLRRFSGPVWSLARRISPTPEDAEDAVQEIFLDLWKSAARFDANVGSEMTFVMTIARRRLIDRTRRRGRMPRADSLAEPESLPDQERADLVEVNDEAARVRAALAQLRPEQQNVLNLALVEGHSHQQVADQTGLPLGTVKSHARRGLMRVRELLGREPDSAPTPKGGSS